MLSKIRRFTSFQPLILVGLALLFPLSAGAGSAQGEKTMEIATFAAGCFWGVEAAFCKLPGVVSTTVGYTGGHTENPSYAQVCTDKTGHAEAVRIEFDPAVISYESLLDHFWKRHDPTSLNRQGPDRGSQYRSAIFYHSPEQKAAAESARQRLTESGRYPRPIVTQIVAAQTFYPAEQYHQRYLEKRGAADCSP